MTVAELIKTLSKMDPNTIVCISHVPGHHQLHVPLTHSGIVPMYAVPGSSYAGETVYREDPHNSPNRVNIVTLD